jgi:hypothetical protein
MEMRGGGAPVELHIDWDDHRHLDTEARIAALTRRVLDAHDARLKWRLRTPAAELGFDGGDRHLHACLAHLATYGVTGSVS